MDSNTELKFYMQMVSDPQSDIYSNLAALDAIDRVYGNGNALQSVVPPDMLSKIRNQADVMMRNHKLPPKSGGWKIEEVK